MVGVCNSMADLVGYSRNKLRSTSRGGAPFERYVFVTQLVVLEAVGFPIMGVLDGVRVQDSV